MSAKRMTVSVLIILAILVVCPSVWAATYYVSGIKGDNLNPGTLEKPWKTIAKANSSLLPGDTVFVMQGTYREVIKPQRSGTEGKHITYANYNNEEAIITGVFDGADLRGKNYITLDGITINDVTGYWVNMDGSSSYNVIKNCNMSGAEKYGGIYIRHGSNYNKILNNTLTATCASCGTDAVVDGPSDTILCWSSKYNLIEGNKIYYGNHQTINIESDGDPTAGHHIIRNNYLYNPWHTNLCITTNANNCLVEGNIIVDAGEDYQNNWGGSDRDRTMARYRHAGIQLSASNTIIRNNVFVNNGSIRFMQWADKWTFDTRFYNNTVYQQNRGIDSNSNGGSAGNIFKNNIIYGSRDYEIYHDDVNGHSGVHFFNNNISGGAIRFAGMNNPQHWLNNVSSDPMFVDPVKRDLRLKQGSPMIDKGAFLTNITSPTKTGTTFTVEDSRYFSDGWNFFQGDAIQLEGQKEIVNIVNITGNTITIDQPILLTQGRGVALAYQGLAPDIGAYEFSTVSPPAGLRIAN